MTSPSHAASPDGVESKACAAESTDPRTVRSRAAIIEATVALMVERGMHAMSLEAIVERSGVAKTTLYRHWQNRDALIVAAWRSLVPEHDEAPDGPIDATLRALVLAHARRIGTPPISILLPDLLAAAGRDETMRDLYEEILRIRRRLVSEAVGAAIADGQLPTETDADLVSTLLLGAVFQEQLILQRVVDASFVNHLVGVVLDAAHARLLVTKPPTGLPSIEIAHADS